MDDTEKLTALKRAYADIILNTAKEAAARVISSERKALQFQQELRATKDEALRMLVRLKQMVDSKVKEAKLLSSSQQKKIEELEAQLQEGEDIVNELREDLRSAQTELEILRKNCKNNFANNMFAHTEKQEKSSETTVLTSDPQSTPSTPSEMVTSNIIQRCGSEKNSGPNEPRELNGNDNPELDTLTLRRKESDLFINRCTQRIHALEGQILRASKTKDDTFSKPASHEHEETLKESINHNQSEVSEKIERKRPRISGGDRHKILSSRHDIDKNGGNDPPLNYPCTKSSKNSGVVEVKFNIGGSNNQKQPENEKGAVTARYRKFISSCNQNRTNLEKELSPVAESVAMETSEIMDSSLVPGDVRNLAAPSDDHGAAEVCRRPGNEKILKYTFMRKRKRKSLSIPDESTFLAENMLVKRVDDRQNGFREPPMSGFTVQPFRVSRRLAEAARQLIALSEEGGQ